MSEMTRAEEPGVARHPARRLGKVRCLSPAGLHDMAYAEWGDPANPRVLICVHGLTRLGTDFTRLAVALCDRYRVVCPDVVGRGRSDWLADPRYYTLPQYMADMVTLVARLGVEQVEWLGTSMGGLIGIMLAGQRGSPISRLVINDVGPRIDAAAIGRIGEYVGAPVSFATVDEAVDYISTIARPFGLQRREDWCELAIPGLRREGERWTLHYDRDIAVPFRAASAEAAGEGETLMWQLYDRIACPTLVMRGETSDLLTHETLQEMADRGPRPKTVEVPGVGHAPTFMHDNEIEIIRDFLGAGASS
jgi:pimeloyl-ACP methyl ester carboxylesterase